MRSIQHDHDADDRRYYQTPHLVAQGAVIEVTKDVKEDGESDGGIFPLDKRDPAGSLGFSL